MKRQITLLGILLFCVFGYAKNMERTVTTKADTLWTRLYQEELSDDGQWISYMLRTEQYEGNADTLHIKNIHDKRHYKIPQAQQLNFAPNSQWAFLSMKDHLVLLSLISGDTIKVKNPDGFTILGKGSYAVVQSSDQNLFIYDDQLQLVKQVKEVNRFFVSPTESIVVNYINGTSAMIPYDQGFEANPISLFEGKIIELQWQENGKSFAYLLEEAQMDKTSKTYSIHTYDVRTKKSKSLGQDRMDPSNNDKQIVPWGDHIVLHPKGNHVFFYISNPKKATHKEGEPEVWLSTSKKEWGDTNVIDRALFPLLAVWYPKTGVYRIIDDGKSEIKITPNREFALFFDPTPYQPNYEVSGTADVYAFNAMTGKQREILKNRALKILTYGISSKGTYFYYIEQGEWWLYNLYSNERTHLTQGLNANWLDSSFDSGGYPEVNDDPVWSKDEKYFIVYDDYDIWYLTADGSQRTRMTKGRESKIKYRLYNPFKIGLKRNKFLDFRSVTWDINTPLLLYATNSLDKSGLKVLKPDGTLEKKIWGPASYSGFDHTSDFNTFIATIQTYSKSPEIKLIDSGTTRTLLKTNPSMDTSGRKAEIITYPSQSSDSLRSIVYFPKNWDPQKKYPAIVYVYEKLTSGYNNFLYPSIFNGTGFNAMRYVQQGYFVIFPDIKFTLGEPGESALNSVTASLDFLNTKQWIDEKRIGLIGHSFGGFETAYIVTQTNRFAAAVCGAGMTNLIGTYLDFDTYRHRNRMWKFEQQQMRMGSPLYEDFQNYLDNSAIYHAKKIQTPLLIWTGSEDGTVDPAHSMQLHLALRRLNKYNVLIRYPNEGHILSSRKNQEHLTRAIEDWFKAHLK